MRADDQPSPEQMAILCRMTPDQRWNVAHQLYWTARKHKKAFLLSQHPDWSEDQAEQEVRQIFLNGRT
jgi:hypothetical protein